MAGADGANRRLVAEDVAAMDAAALAPALQACLRPGAINLQWYAAGLDVGRPRCDCDSAGDPLVRRHPADG